MSIHEELDMFYDYKSNGSIERVNIPVAVETHNGLTFETIHLSNNGHSVLLATQTQSSRLLLRSQVGTHLSSMDKAVIVLTKVPMMMNGIVKYLYSRHGNTASAYVCHVDLDSVRRYFVSNRISIHSPFSYGVIMVDLLNKIFDDLSLSEAAFNAQIVQSEAYMDI